MKAVVRSTDKDVFVHDIQNAAEEVVIGGLVLDIGTTTVSALIINMETGDSAKHPPETADPLWSRCH